MPEQGGGGAAGGDDSLDPAAAGEMTGPQAGKRAAALLTLIGAGLIILAATRTWARIDLGSLLPGMSSVTVSGRRAVPAAVPIALAAVAGAVVLLTSGRVVRVLVAAGLAIGGGLLAVATVHSTRDASGMVDKALRDALGVFSSNSGSVSAGGIFYGGSGSGPAITIWPWLTGIGAVLMVGAGLLVLIMGWSWPGPARRFERAGNAGSPTRSSPLATGSASVADRGQAATWDALSRGEDPTSKVDDVT